MLAFGWLFNILERGRASYDRIRSILDEPVDVKDTPNTLDQVPTGDIAFHIDDFTYLGEQQPVLKQIHFRLRRGETLGIVGKTGAGKTTLLKLLIRESEGFDGDILFGERRIDQYKLERLREAIGYVPQEHFLFSATVAENISFAKPDASIEEISSCREISKGGSGYSSIYGRV